MIEQLKDIQGRTASIEEALNNIVRVGTVVNRDEALHRCRVEFKDNDTIVSYWCQVLVQKTYEDKQYWLPDIAEMVICLFLPYGHEQGFILGSAYNGKDKPPADATKDRFVRQDKGGNQWLMDRKCKKCRIKTKELHIYGNLIVHGTIYDRLGDLTEHTNLRLPRDPLGGPPGWECD